MKKLILLSVMFCCSSSFSSSSVSFSYPHVKISFLSPPPGRVFYGETLRIPVLLTYTALQGHKEWSLPNGCYLEVVSGYCPSIPYHVGNMWSGGCIMNIVIPGSFLGNVITGRLSYYLWGKVGSHHWNYLEPAEEGFHVTVIPHFLSILPIPVQEATANQPFIYNLKSIVKFYDENLIAGLKPQGIITPPEQDGLRFDPVSFSIVGTPKRIGTYLFQMRAQNAYSTSATIDFKAQVHVNPKDKPILKQHHLMASALPEQKYSINLMELVEPKPGFMVTNQISFRIDTRNPFPEWLHVAIDDATRLEGIAPKDTAGQGIKITLIASSNTGGDSLPLTVTIPIAYAPGKKPVINSFELHDASGRAFYKDLSPYINDPGHDSNLRLILDKVEPSAPWLRVSPLNPTALEGTIPDEATGQLFNITLLANTQIGGSSAPVIIPLQVNTNKEQEPRFKAANPLLPLCYSEQPFLYDFVANRDIYPEYSDVPYEINFVEGFHPPVWLRLEDNKLIADKVPSNAQGNVDLKIAIKNIPGGISEEYLLRLKIIS